MRVALGFVVPFVENGCKSGLDFGDFLLFFFFELFMNTGHVFGGSFLFHLLKSSEGFQVLFFSHFSGINVGHDIFFILLESVQGLTEFQDGDSTILITDGCVLSTGNLVTAPCVTDLDWGKRSIWHFVGEGDFILSVIIIPNIEPSVLSGEEESAWSGWGETTVTQVTAVISGLYQWSLKIVHPNLSAPVAHCHEYLGKLQVSANWINWAQMSVLHAQSRVDFNWSFWFLICYNNGSLFSTDHKFSCCFRTIFKCCGSDSNLLSISIDIFNFQRFSSFFLKFSGIPEISESISWYWDTFITGFGHEPLEMSDWITVRSLNVGQGNGISTGSWVPHSNNTVCAASTNDVSEFVIIWQVSEGWWWIEGSFWGVGVLKIPDIRASFHFIGGLLEPWDGIGNGQFVGAFNVPTQFAYRSFTDVARILE